MNTPQITAVKAAFEIGLLAGQLTPKNQSYVLNTINALLFSQETNDKSAQEQKGA
ncbi:hypothetical protein [Paenibacillus popilliae]|uniref:Superfamily II DNA and RNA helicase n=1 Tax=Paenibacillus popilliae ATCC 14706 TaxID=1212764 RepID=M9L8V6_PAEPP|nr:hypothetical protein [Paenibacillus popilliae]GAC41687.1 superfamily II DNA and RNA helicase [Paenibacillus popilliae ATCC 14706]